MISRRGAYARKVLKNYHQSIRLPSILYPPRPTEPAASGTGTVTNIGIVGAGISGLYTALMLDWLKDPKFTYEILEANPTRAGGRLYTETFKTGDPYDYYDVGAMRFPNLHWMEPTTKLMKHLDVPRMKYIMNDKLKNNISFFNNRRLSAKEIEAQIAAGNYDVFCIGLGLKKSPEDILASIFGPFKEKLSSDDPAIWNQGLDELLQYDDWSTRHYMRFRPDKLTDLDPGRLSHQMISFLETIDTSTGNYDQAFVESVLDSVDFSTPNTKWECVDGGAKVIVDKACKILKKGGVGQIKHDKRVTSIPPHISEGNTHITLKAHGLRVTRSFVITCFL